MGVAQAERGKRMDEALELGKVSAVADLLERSSSVTTAALVAKLPLAGIATNTFLSG